MLGQGCRTALFVFQFRFMHNTAAAVPIGSPFTCWVQLLDMHMDTIFITSPLLFNKVCRLCACLDLTPTICCS